MRHVCFLYCLLAAAIMPASATQCGGVDDPPIKDVVADHLGTEFHLVVDWRLSKGVDGGRCPLDELSSPIARGQYVHVWMRTAGNESALDRLVREERLPLKHAWHYRAGADWGKPEIIDVSGQTVTEPDIAGLKRELENREFFDWRTWSYKKNLAAGRWRVTIVDRLGREIDCIDDAVACSIEFEVH